MLHVEVLASQHYFVARAQHVKVQVVQYTIQHTVKVKKTIQTKNNISKILNKNDRKAYSA